MTLDEIITPQTVKLVKGEGMPIAPSQNSEDLMNHLKTVPEMPKGDLYIKFDIHFPAKMSNSCK